MDINQIKQLIDLMEERSLADLEVQDGEKRVAIKRHLGNTASVAPVATTLAPAAPIPATPKGATEDSPMVGVFYVAPSPNDPPFVKVGQQVQAGDTLGIVEAMKIMNPLEATQNGIIAEILVKNGDVVQFGQPIVRYQA
ncbi:acetyl-CoA carboxylase biotin carboxyl carrier protein AccB [Moraxella macacae 0408225]|uniref:Biotin carboxyl carrier protein of acetyl-CoA carboxylase n=1 Tax=Moraxella macacae 0408225 TaxID=1230338 RepID=L2F638_9GAMM|nr:acetyl-CoA carboxylase biotin carboxyl carrier protein [Moraxella macacae]ELA08370.1 acetyl-CoA carboxylase biotin carboxyl carrier protein AccB [Moraxella macacae 0408225]